MRRADVLTDGTNRAAAAAWVGRISLIAVATALAGCAPFAGRQTTGISQPTTTVQAAEWTDGIMLPAGQRAAVLVLDKTGWILTRTLATDELLLSAVSLSDGGTRTALLKGIAPGSVGAGLASDGIGHLWVTIGQEVVRVDEPGGAIRHWALPEPPPDAAPSDENPGAGNAEAAAWDRLGDALLFVRNGDHRLYRFDPATGTVSVAADLPITTSYISRLTIGTDGSIEVTGSRSDSVAFAPAVVRVPTGSGAFDVRDNVVAVCSGPSGFSELDSAGDVNVVSSTTRQLGNLVPMARSNVPFGCDPQGNVFAITVADGLVNVGRLSPTGSLSTMRLALTQTGPIQGLSGAVSPYQWVDPRLVAVLPDGDGGVWLVSESGTQSVEDLQPGYPSLWRATFPP